MNGDAQLQNLKDKEFLKVSENKTDEEHNNENDKDREGKFKSRLLAQFIEYFCLRQRVPLKELMSHVERNILIKTLSIFDGNQRKAAKFLSVKPTTLHEKIKKYEIRFDNGFYSD